MKIFVSADIEGTTGIASWDETRLDSLTGAYFREQMTREVGAACEAAIKMGAAEVLVKDAHSTARNIDPSKLPEGVKIMRGWTKHPYVMMAGLDDTFDGVVFTGYHSAADTNGNPLAHTMDSSNNVGVRINDMLASEFTINAYTAASLGIPVLFLSGDKQLCEEAKKLNPNIKTVAVSEGVGNASISINPGLAVKRIYEGVSEAVRDDLSRYLIKLPDKFKVEIEYIEHFLAYKNSFYPGAVQVGPRKVRFESDDYMEVLKFFLFVL